MVSRPSSVLQERQSTTSWSATSTCRTLRRLQLLGAIRRRTVSLKHLPVLMVTAEGAQRKHRAAPPGAASFIVKPFRQSHPGREKSEDHAEAPPPPERLLTRGPRDGGLEPLTKLSSGTGPGASRSSPARHDRPCAARHHDASWASCPNSSSPPTALPGRAQPPPEPSPQDQRPPPKGAQLGGSGQAGPRQICPATRRMADAIGQDPVKAVASGAVMNFVGDVRDHLASTSTLTDIMLAGTSMTYRQVVAKVVTLARNDARTAFCQAAGTVVPPELGLKVDQASCRAPWSIPRGAPGSRRPGQKWTTCWRVSQVLRLRFVEGDPPCAVVSLWALLVWRGPCRVRPAGELLLLSARRKSQRALQCNPHPAEKFAPRCSGSAVLKQAASLAAG